MSDSVEFVPRGVGIWRYMDVARFLALIDEKRLYFARLHELSDPWEGVWRPAACKDGMVSLPSRAVVRLAILAFLLRGAFYCVEQPIWEGFDEWAHFGYIQRIAHSGRLPSRAEPVSAQLRRAVEVAPASEVAAPSAGSLTYDAYWRLPPAERINREVELRGLRFSYKSAAGGGRVLMQYEAQQPPLYYLLLAVPLLAMNDASVPAQVLALRLVSLMLSAAGVLLCYSLASKIPACRRAAIPVLLLLASWPGLVVDVSRIGNDGLAMALGSATILCLFRIARRGSGMRDWVLAGAVLGAGLLTKSYMLALLPLLPLVALAQALGRKPKPRAAWGCALALALVGLVAGWWYVGAWQVTGTFSGEQIDAAAVRFGLAGKLAAIRTIDWARVLDSVATTHIWTGGWSFLGVRSWMYRVFESLAVAAGVGLALLAGRISRRAWRRGALGDGELRLCIAACAYLFFSLGIAYFAIVVFLTHGISTALGWYLDGIAGAEAALFACGITGLLGIRRGVGCVAGTALLAAALDIYTVQFVSAPYYAGLTAHLPSGLLGAFHFGSLRGVGLQGVFARLAIDKPAGVGPPVIAAVWAGYLCATAGLMVYSGAIFKNAFFPRRRARHGGGRWQAKAPAPPSQPSPNFGFRG